MYFGINLASDYGLVVGGYQQEEGMLQLLMVALKGMKPQTDCKKCPFMATDGADELSPMMCIALWATKHEVEHCVSEKVLDDCPLVEVEDEEVMEEEE